jgi:hypothetical protein
MYKKPAYKTDINQTEQNLRQTLRVQLNTRLIWIGTILLDTAFLIIWLLLQYLTNYLITMFPALELDKLLLMTFKFLFGFSTLIPIALFIYKDLRIMIIRTKKDIQIAKENNDV